MSLEKCLSRAASLLDAVANKFVTTDCPSDEADPLKLLSFLCLRRWKENRWTFHSRRNAGHAASSAPDTTVL